MAHFFKKMSGQLQIHELRDKNSELNFSKNFSLSL